MKLAAFQIAEDLLTTHKGQQGVFVRGAFYPLQRLEEPVLVDDSAPTCEIQAAIERAKEELTARAKRASPEGALGIVQPLSLQTKEKKLWVTTEVVPLDRPATIHFKKLARRLKIYGSSEPTHIPSHQGERR